MDTNKAKFQQACNTPFANEPLMSIVSPRGITSASDDIFSSKFIPPWDIDEEAKESIEAVTRSEAVTKGGYIDSEITIEKYKSFWSRAREATQSSLSGLHFGFYITITKNDILAKLSSQFVNLQFRTGYSSWRSRGDLNVSLQKQAGNCDQNK